MLNWEKDQYGNLITKILEKGEKRETRNGFTYSLFAETIKIDLSLGFPLLQGRKLFHKGVLGELAAMLRGPKTVQDFKKFGCNYWDSWGDKEGNINVDYGNAWIDFNGVNQLEKLIEKLTKTPHDRRLLISGWRPDNLDVLSLPCCHLLYQWYVRNNECLDMVWYQRSVDTMVGLPSDIILCAAWNIILAQQVGYKPGICTFYLGDTHIYSNHLEPTIDYIKQLNAIKFDTPIPYELDPKATVYNFRPEMLEIKEYNPQSTIKFSLNV